MKLTTKILVFIKIKKIFLKELNGENEQGNILLPTDILAFVNFVLFFVLSVVKITTKGAEIFTENHRAAYCTNIIWRDLSKVDF